MIPNVHPVALFVHFLLLHTCAVLQQV